MRHTGSDTETTQEQVDAWLRDHNQFRVNQEVADLARSLPVAETVRATLAVVRAERDHAHLLLRVLSALGYVPDGALLRAVNSAVAQESESDIENAQRAVDEWIAAHLPDEHYNADWRP